MDRIRVFTTAAAQPVIRTVPWPKLV